jgi:tetratricopeptide (TPR) repeat protein
MKPFLPLAALALAFVSAHAQRTDPYLLAAQQAEVAHDLPTAVRNYRAYLDAHPKSAEAHIKLSTVLLEQKDYDAAIGELQFAVPLVGRKQRPTLLTDIGLAEIKKNDIPAAKAQFNAALAIDPRNLLAAAFLANTDLHQNDPEAALKDLGPLGPLADQNAELAQAYSEALIRTGQLHQGAMILARVADTKDDAALFTEAGAAFLQDGEPENARRALESAHRLSPQDATVDTLVGIARILLADPFAAETAFREALALQPDNFLANVYLGVTLLSRRNSEAAARPFFDRAQQLSLPSSKPLKEGGVFQTDSGSLDPAIALLKQIATKSPSDPEPHFQLAALYSKLNRTAEAAAERRLAESLTTPAS